MKAYREDVSLARWSRVAAFWQENPDGHRYDLHYHPESELVWIGEGEGVMHLAGAVLPYRVGDVVAIDRGVPHTFTSHQPSRGIVVQYATDALSGFEADECSPERANGAGGVVVDGSARPELGALFESALASSDEVQPVDGLRTRSALYSILAEIAGLPLSCSAPGPTAQLRAHDALDTLTKILNFVHSDPGRSISLKDAAAVADMRPESLCRFLKRHLEKTFTELVNDARLEEAARELAATDRKVLGIALDTGYKNLSYFNRRFKQRFGMTPLSYRRRYSGPVSRPRSVVSP